MSFPFASYICLINEEKSDDSFVYSFPIHLHWYKFIYTLLFFPLLSLISWKWFLVIYCLSFDIHDLSGICSLCVFPVILFKNCILVHFYAIAWKKSHIFIKVKKYSLLLHENGNISLHNKKIIQYLGQSWKKNWNKNYIFNNSWLNFLFRKSLNISISSWRKWRRKNIGAAAQQMPCKQKIIPTTTLFSCIDFSCHLFRYNRPL